MRLPEQTPDRLLAAAEWVVQEQGARSATIRRIASVSGLNSALVSYHFGGLDSLLRQVLELNVNAICSLRSAALGKSSQLRDADERLRAVLAAYLESLWRTPSFWSGGSARLVVRELMLMLDRSLQKHAIAQINTSLEETAAHLAPFVPHLDHDELMTRLRLLAGAADMARPTVDALGLYPLSKVEASKRDAYVREQLMLLSLSAIR